MSRLFPFVLLLLTACGLAENERDEQNKYEYINLYDAAFREYCLEKFDGNGDGKFSVYEAQRVVEIDCSARGIAVLSGIDYFINLRRLECRGNALTSLDVRRCARLESLVCRDNDMTQLDIRGLRSLTLVECSANRLDRLDVLSNASLSSLTCGSNNLVTLDVSACARAMQLLDTRDNPLLTTLYYAAGQSFGQQRVDGQTQMIAR